MKSKLFTITFLLLLCGNMLFAQNTTHFVNSGVIEYDKLINAYALINSEIKIIGDDSYYKLEAEAYKKFNPQFTVLKSTLTFGNNKTLFVPGPKPEHTDYNMYYTMPMIDQNNIIYTDMSTSTRVSQKSIFDDKYLVTDSTSKIKWKITDETRDILGYTCRRANGLTLDSIYVVAFYTDKIPVSGGPESLTGLPGMILQVALPHENISWIATKITDTTVPETTLTAPKKGKAITAKELRNTLQKSLKRFGGMAQLYIKAFLL